AWGVSLSAKPGLTAPEMTHYALEGKIRALYVMGENIVLSDPNVWHTIKALKKLDLLVVQDIFLTETAKEAHVVFPSACFAEKDGTFHNTERRVQRVRKAVEPPGDAKDDIWIISELSKRIGYPMNYSNPEEIYKEFGEVWAAVKGISYYRLEKEGVQWPCPSADHPGTEYLYKDGFPKGKPAFTIVHYLSAKEEVDEEYPFILTNGRNLFHYHFASMTKRVKAIDAIAGQPYIEINPQDAQKLNIKDNDLVKVASRRGEIKIKAKVTDTVKVGEVFIPMHYAEAAVNVLTNDMALDSVTKTPEFKVACVKIEALSS
ncbi:MAG: molybdopterin-dependent oxidoreductase, partial [Thermodesulfovibrionales bacterium]|nr:molybdopterin-dependent oxidoreductase [Thermodesulfovibrionales bacterium]